MFKLVLEKAEEPEIKLPISAGSSKKQETAWLGVFYSSLESKHVKKKIDSDKNVWVTKINCYTALRFPTKATF